MSALMVSIQKELDTLPTLSKISGSFCIYRVPKTLRQKHEEAYTPVLVSIGPFHHKNERLLPMETHKLKYLQSFIKHSNAGLSSYLDIIKDKESKIRECYAEPIDMSSDDFVRMVLIDSVFIIELFRGPLFVMPFTRVEVMGDLKLAENQLPFFILKDLYRVAFKPVDDISGTTFTGMACIWLGVDKGRVKVDPRTNEAEVCCHFLDLLRSHRLPSDQHQSSHTHEHHLLGVDYKSIFCPTATSLHEAGVKFRVANINEPCNLLDIDFNMEKGVLTIPKLAVGDNTELLFRNLIAFEQCHYSPYNNYFADYHFFMDRLINTKEDVQLLAKEGIIRNWLGSDEELACLINSQGSNVCTSHHYYYARITNQLNEYSSKRWNRYRATLMHTYFKHPWAFISVIYAAILLLLTIIQVVTGILAI